jgi:hypothetical protein
MHAAKRSNAVPDASIPVDPSIRAHVERLRRDRFSSPLGLDSPPLLTRDRSSIHPSIHSFIPILHVCRSRRRRRCGRAGRHRSRSHDAIHRRLSSCGASSGLVRGPIGRDTRREPAEGIRTATDGVGSWAHTDTHIESSRVDDVRRLADRWWCRLSFVDGLISHRR